MLTYLQTTQANPISIAKSSALVSSKLDKSGMDKSLLVWTVIGDERASCFSSLGFFGASAPSAVSPFIYYTHTHRTGKCKKLMDIFKIRKSLEQLGYQYKVVYFT